MNKPLVTIITPVYNCGKYIMKTMHSVLNQNYKKMDYMVINDASTDGVNGWLNKGFVFNEGNINLYIGNHKVNRGEQKTVNEGLRMVRGKYFMIVNADDPLLPGAVDSLVEFMEANPDVLCAYPDYDVIGEDGEFHRHVTTREYDFTWMVQHHTWLPSVGSIFRSSLIKDIGLRDTSLQWLGDAEYWLRVGIAGKMAHVPLTLACWRSRNGQASGDKSDKRAREHIRIIKQLYHSSTMPQGIWDVRHEAICWSYLVAAAVTDSKVKTIKYLLTAISIYPKMLIDIRLWDLLIKRAIFILRR